MLAFDGSEMRNSFGQFLPAFVLPEEILFYAFEL